MYTYAKRVKHTRIYMQYSDCCLHSYYILGCCQAYDQAKEGASEHLTEGVTEHGLEILRVELAIAVDVA